MVNAAVAIVTFSSVLRCDDDDVSQHAGLCPPPPLSFSAPPPLSLSLPPPLSLCPPLSLPPSLSAPLSLSPSLSRALSLSLPPPLSLLPPSLSLSLSLSLSESGCAETAVVHLSLSAVLQISLWRASEVGSLLWMFVFSPPCAFGLMQWM